MDNYEDWKKESILCEIDGLTKLYFDEMRHTRDLFFRYELGISNLKNICEKVNKLKVEIGDNDLLTTLGLETLELETL